SSLLRAFVLLSYCRTSLPILFFFNDTATTEIYPLSLHDALPILFQGAEHHLPARRGRRAVVGLSFDQHQRRFHPVDVRDRRARRSEEHTSELQSRGHLVCRLLLEKKKKDRWRVGCNGDRGSEDYL